MATDPELSQSDYSQQEVIVPDSILRSGLSRRGMLKAMGLFGGATALVGGGALGLTATGGRGKPAAYVLPEGFTGTMADLKHVVILMQENRSFDHYYGAMPGLRGFNDKQALRFQNGTTVFSQPSGSSTVKPKHSRPLPNRRPASPTTTARAPRHGTAAGTTTGCRPRAARP